jgi:hypothetical protein
MAVYGATVARLFVPPLVRLLGRFRKRLMAPVMRFLGCVGAKKQRMELFCGKLADSRKKRLKKFYKIVKMGVSKL